jgi:peptidoglycan hydrolase-like protein with peptidoglycan-binding domain
VRNLQQRLTSMGYDTKGADGIVGTNTRKAFQRWQADNSQTPDGFITQRSASSLAGW